MRVEQRPQSEVQWRPGNRPTPKWSVIIVGWLLLLQTLGLVAIAVYNLVGFQVTWSRIAMVANDDPYRALVSGIYVLIALVAALAAAGFLDRWPHAWLHAMIVQGVSLAVALVSYFRSRPGYIYLVMAYCAFMVLYLNYYEVRAAFAEAEREGPA
jgi:hypothetical protein